MIVHFDRLKSMYGHSANFWSLHTCGSICCMLSVSIAKSSTYPMVVHVVGEILKWYPMLSGSYHLIGILGILRIDMG